MENITFIDLKKATYWKGLAKNEIRIKLTGRDRHISFNQSISTELRQKKYSHVNVGIGANSQSVYLVFNHKEGYPIPDPTKYRVYTIRGKGIINFLQEHFHLEGSSCELHISDNLAKTSTYSTYKLTMPTTSTMTVED